MTLTVGSLFSGIGGLDLGLERAGMRVIWQSEIDPYATRVLAKHWPGVPNYGDITRIDWGNIVRPDVICGGYPCQPFSTAGHRRGENDPRHLWPYVRDAISHLRPRYAILENVRGHLSLGGLSVLSDLTALGYDAEWRIVSAVSVGANHRRDRVIIVAYPNREDESHGALDVGRETHLGMVADADDARSGASRRDPERERASSVERRQELAQSGPGRRGPSMENSDGRRLEKRQPERQQVYRISSASELPNYDGHRWWQTEPELGRVANGIPARVDRLKGLGNAVVPQVAEVIGRLVVAHHEQNPD